MSIYFLSLDSPYLILTCNFCDSYFGQKKKKNLCNSYDRLSLHISESDIFHRSILPSQIYLQVIFMGTYWTRNWSILSKEEEKVALNMCCQRLRVVLWSSSARRDGTSRIDSRLSWRSLALVFIYLNAFVSFSSWFWDLYFVWTYVWILVITVGGTCSQGAGICNCGCNHSLVNMWGWDFLYLKKMYRSSNLLNRAILPKFLRALCGNMFSLSIYIPLS